MAYNAFKIQAFKSLVAKIFLFSGYSYHRIKKRSSIRGCIVLYFHNPAEKILFRYINMLEKLGYKNSGLYRDDDVGQETGSTYVITFDDGYVENMLLAKKISDGGRGATFFLNTVGIENGGNKNTKRKWLSWEHIQAISLLDNINIEMHTHSHVDLTAVKEEVMYYEILRNRELINDITGKVATRLSYPYGRYNREVVNALKRSEVLEGYTTKPLRWMGETDRYHIPRFAAVDDFSIGCMRIAGIIYSNRNTMREL